MPPGVPFRLTEREPGGLFHMICCWLEQARSLEVSIGDCNFHLFQLRPSREYLRMTNQYSDTQHALRPRYVSVRGGHLTKFKGQVADIVALVQRSAQLQRAYVEKGC